MPGGEPAGGGFFMKEEFFCWKNLRRSFFLGKKMTGHFSSALFFFRK